MKHKEEQRNIDSLFYLVGLLAGVACGIIIDKTLVLTAVLGLVGLLFAGFFLNVFVRGRGSKA